MQHIFQPIVECIITFNLIFLPTSNPSKLMGLKTFVSFDAVIFFVRRDSGHLFN